MIQQRSQLQKSSQAGLVCSPGGQGSPAAVGCRRVAARTSKQRYVCGRGELQITASLIRRDDVHTVTKLPKPIPRDSIRLGLPSKGRMAEDTMQLLKDCALSVYKPNPRQYVAKIPQIPGVEVWFQRASDVVRKLRLGDIDLGIVGYDMFQEIGDGDSDLVVVHEALGFGHCHLALGVPMGGKFANINNLEQLRAMDCWTEETPLRVVTGYHAIAKRFFDQAGFEHVALLTADGALEAAPAMGCADIILDLVSTGVTLKENNLREIEGGRIVDSQGVLVANRRSLTERPQQLLPVLHELLERLDAHLKAEQFYSVIANMRGESPEAVATLLMQQEGLRGLQGPTISPVYSLDGSASGAAAKHGFYACVICVAKKNLYPSVKALQKIGGSGVLVQPMTYIFDEEPLRWQRLLAQLGIDEAAAGNDPAAAAAVLASNGTAAQEAAPARR
uniref:ATP phosphoribosyltransferase n=1 Tax=Tetradesmus obliquus TaxID=3088 RepID=A0A383WIE3_TETOB|eukprot:jgi/Sobl393_1/9644/SZX77247.1